MSDDQIDRRTALKVIAVGISSAGALPLLEEASLGQSHSGMSKPQATQEAQPRSARFFSEAELTTIAILSDLIIPADEHSPGARDAGVPDFIAQMISESSTEVQSLWRDGVKAINDLSQASFATDFNNAAADKQISLLRTISKNEYRPRTIAERFFIAVKSMTVDGYYTSEVGIHKDLRYKGNAYLTEFEGCTHPEHRG